MRDRYDKHTTRERLFDKIISVAALFIAAVAVLSATTLVGVLLVQFLFARVGHEP